MLPASLRRPHALAWPVAKHALASVAALATLAAFGVLVRTLPWLLSSAVPLSTLAPLARGLLVVALEASGLFGIPIGVALATARWVESGEARVFALLGESPAGTTRNVAVWVAPLFALFVGVAYQSGQEAANPGRFAAELLHTASTQCARPGVRSASVPFISATWLCLPDHAPQLVGKAPLGNLWFGARTLDFTGDLRGAELTDAQLVFAKVHVSARHVTLRGLPSLLPASAVAARSRAGWLGCMVVLCAWILMHAQLAFRARAPATPFAAVAAGLAGPAAGLLWYRFLEAHPPPAASWLSVPAIAGVTTFCLLWVLSNLPRWKRTGTH